jgi:hypothetical protein
MSSTSFDSSRMTSWRVTRQGVDASSWVKGELAYERHVTDVDEQVTWCIVYGATVVCDRGWQCGMYLTHPYMDNTI